MKSLEEFKSYYQQSLFPQIVELEKQRKACANKVILICLPVIVLTLICTYLVRSSEDGIKVVLAIGIVITIGAYWALTHNYVSDFKDIVIARIVKFLDPTFAYNKHAHITLQQYKNSNIFLTHVARYEGDDYVKGKLGATAVEFSEIHPQYETRDHKGRTTYHTIFKGLFFIADFNKHFKGSTFVLPDRMEKLFGNFSSMFQKMNMARPDLVKLEDPEFEKMFVVYGTDQVESRYILSTSLMKRIVDFKRKSRRNIFISFVNSNVYIAISYMKNLFEPKIFHTLLDFRPIQEYFEDLQLATGIVEDLNLNTRIWTKV